MGQEINLYNYHYYLERGNIEKPITLRYDISNVPAAKATDRVTGSAVHSITDGFAIGDFRDEGWIETVYYPWVCKFLGERLEWICSAMQPASTLKYNPQNRKVSSLQKISSLPKCSVRKCRLALPPKASTGTQTQPH